jgi:hypothetical protein
MTVVVSAVHTHIAEPPQEVECWVVYIAAAIDNQELYLELDSVPVVAHNPV